MKLRNLLIFGIITFVFLSFTDKARLTHPSYLQKPTPDSDFKIMFQDAQELFDYEYYEDALNMFLKLLPADKNNCNVNFYIGACYLNLNKQKTKAIEYLEKAIVKTDISYSYNYKETAAPVFAYEYLGEAYHYAGKYTEALSNYAKFKTFLTDKNKDAKFIQEVDHYIEIANNAVKLTATPVKVTTEAFKIMNSVSPDYTPIISSDGTKFYLTSKRKGAMGGQKDNLGEFFDDIYWSQLKAGKWGKPKKMGSKINSVNIDVLNCISADGNQLYFSRQTGNSYDIYFCEVSKKGKWSVPKKLDKIINGKSNEICAFTSPDGKFLLFSSDRAGGFGGYDMYISGKQESGEWGKPKNLGQEVNTKYDDCWPVVMDDGTLFFSSKGHNTMGGFDIFKAKIQDDSTYTDPVNMGYPLNTPFDDRNFTPSSTTDWKKGYYSSGRTGGFGDGDIYSYDFSK